MRAVHRGATCLGCSFLRSLLAASGLIKGRACFHLSRRSPLSCFSDNARILRAARAAAASLRTARKRLRPEALSRRRTQLVARCALIHKVQRAIFELFYHRRARAPKQNSREHYVEPLEASGGCDCVRANRPTRRRRTENIPAPGRSSVLGNLKCWPPKAMRRRSRSDGKNVASRRTAKCNERAPGKISRRYLARLAPHLRSGADLLAR